MKTKLLDIIRRIAYEPTRAETQVYADTILQQLTAMVAIDNAPMAVMVRKNKPGIILGFNTKLLKDYSDAQLATMLSHETQHIRVNDMADQANWKAERDWYNGWDGALLHNAARDCQINDQLVGRLGMARVDPGMYGPDAVGAETVDMPLEDVMRLLAQKPAPPPEEQPQDLQAEELEAADAKDSNDQTLLMQEGRLPAPKAPQRAASVGRSDEQARFDNFLAEILDTRKFSESWYRVPKRLGGVKEFAEREAVVPFKTPIPRKTALLAIDVSGSMDEGGVRRLCGLIRSAPANYELTVVCFDDSLAEWKDFRNNSALPIRGGGTDFSLVEAYAQKMIRYPDAVLVLTDGGGHIPEVRRPRNWTWVLYQANVQAFQEMAQMRSVDLEKVIKRR